MCDDEFPPGWDEACIQRVLAHYDRPTEDEVVAEDEGAIEGEIEFHVSTPSPAELVATWKHLMHAHVGGPVQPKFVIEEVNDPDAVAKLLAQDERARRNEIWLQSHWSELLQSARGRFIAVAGQEAFIADSQGEARAKARAAHPTDDGIIEQYIRPERGPRLYAHPG